MPVFVNNVEITDEEVCAEMQFHPSENQQKASYEAAQALVIRELLLQQAKACHLVDDLSALEAEDEGEIIDQLLQDQVRVPTADEKTCQHYYETYPGSFFKNGTKTRLSFIEAQPYIVDYLHTKAMRISVAEYLKALLQSATIEGIELVVKEG